ncbi:MAG: S16 family serine protease [Candidatus Diapherotrites archaeon]
MMKKGTLLLLFVFLACSTPLAWAIIEKGSIPIYAVTSSDEALRAELMIEIVPGTGRAWSSVEPLVGTSTQNTERISVGLAKNYFGKVDQYDYKFDINSNASVVEGPSAGAAMALLLISMLQGKELPEYVSVTGQIAEDGSIGAVGGVFEKAQKASETGITVFLVPKGEAYQMHRFPDGIKTVNLPDYALSEWGLKVIEVSNIDEALELAFTKPENIDVNRVPAQKPEIFVPEGIEIGEELLPMKELTQKYVDEAQKALEDAKTALNESPLEDPAIVSVLLDSLSGSERTIETAKLLLEKNYLYSAANSAFLAKVNSALVKDLSENPSLVEPNSALLDKKISDLGNKLSLLEKDLNSFYSAKYLEWVVAAKERFYWAKLNIKNLSGTKTIIIGSSGASISDIGIAIENLRDYEYASEWMKISEDFLEIAKRADDKIKPVPLLEKKAEEYIIAAENELALVPLEEADDIERRLNAAKLARQEGWHDSAAFDAASALALAKAEREIQGKGYGELVALLGEKLANLRVQFSKGGPVPVWAKLYFDHALYFYDSAKYFESQKDTPNAADNAKAGLRLAFFAEEMAVITKQARSELAALPAVEKIQSTPAPGLERVVLGNDAVALLAIALAVLAVAAFLLLANAARMPSGKPQEEFISKRMERLDKMRHLAEKARLGEKLSEEEYQTMKAEHDEKFLALEEEKKTRSRHLLETDRLHGEIQMIQFMLKELKEQYDKGEIVDADYREALDSLTNRLSSVKSEASDEEAEVSQKGKKIAALKEEAAKPKPKIQKIKPKAGKEKQEKGKWAFKR